VLPDGEKIRRFRQGKFWSQEKLADEARLRKRTIERAEAGERLQRTTLSAIAQALSLPPEALVSSGSASEPHHGRGQPTSPRAGSMAPVQTRVMARDEASHEASQADPSGAETSLSQAPGRCSGCGAENLPRMKFCTACGLPLQSRCPRCGAERVPGAKFCAECGVSFAERSFSLQPQASISGPQTPLSYTPVYLAEKILTSKGALEGERKQVTVLVASLRGATESLADRDPEEGQKLLDPLLERMLEAVHRYEGTVNHILGDGMMALFGAPLAHEDHAARACYAALAMQKAIHQYTEALRRDRGITIQLWVGLNSGEVVVRAIGNDLHMEYSAVGQTTFLAARMEQLAREGGIWLTAATLRLVEGLVQVKSLGPVRIEGLAGPMEIFELIGAEPTRTRLQAAAARLLTPFVGRQHELEVLHQALERAGTGHGQVVAVIGEPGVGKSRLFYEFTHAHDARGWLILEAGAVSSYGKATPYLPIIDLLKAYFQVEGPDDGRGMPEQVTDKLLALDETLRPTVPALLMLLDVPVEDPQWQALDPRQRRQRTLDAIKRLLMRESQVHPLLLIVDNLHWIDAETQAVLDGVVESLPAARILLLVNYRPDYQHGWGNKTFYTQLRLDPLPPARAEELLRALLGQDASLQPLKQRLIERTEGNPFFLEESVWTLAETKALLGERGAYRLARALPTIQVPSTVQAMLAARIDRLPPEDKRLLQAAAVIGRDVPSPLLQAIVEEPEEVIRRSIAHLQAAEFLYELQLFPEHVYTFKHALTQEVAYHSLLQHTRQRYHQRIAQVLAGRFPDTAATQPELLAHHYTEAGMAAQAVPYWQQAGQRAIERSANVEAISHLTKGLELLKSIPETSERSRHELVLQLSLGTGFALHKGWATPEAELAFTRASELCRQVGDSRQRFSALLRLMHLNQTKGRLRTLRELCEEGLTLAEDAQDPALLETAHQEIGSVLFFMGEPAAALEHLKQCVVQHHRSLTLDAGFEPAVMSLSRASFALWMLGYPDRALAWAHEALAMARQLSHPHSLVIALQYSAALHSARREASLVQERAEAVMALSCEHGFTLWLAGGRLWCGWALAEQGRAEEGIAQLRQGLATYQTLGAGLGQTHFLARLAEAYKRGGYLGEGLRVLDEALVAVREREERYYEAEIYRLKGEFLLLQDSGSGEAESCLRQAFDVACQQQATSLELRAAMSLSLLWQSQGKRPEARQLLAEVYDWFTEGFETPDLREAKALLEALT
jgi:class 3 adenylate cyclase/tetratricopeptide (TPR) repeat protein/transcriptional regulator with XRE-family HTH domain